MNVLIVDCGATNCNYCIISDKKNVSNCTIKGFSPVANSWDEFPQFETKIQVDKVFFYGTAMFGEALGRAQKELRKQFPLSELSVLSDLHAAAYATVGDNDGYVHILGTGSSTSYIEHGELSFPLINMGYLWEDYASGFDIAKTMIEYWMNSKLSSEEQEIFDALLGDKREFLRKTYTSQSPKLFLAKYSNLIHKLSVENQLKIKNERLELFFTKNINNFADSKTHHFIGSMAKLLEPEIRAKMQLYSKSVGVFVKDTNEGLLNYHINKMTNQHG